MILEYRDTINDEREELRMGNMSTTPVTMFERTHGFSVCCSTVASKYSVKRPSTGNQFCTFTVQMIDEEASK